jgi:type IX secretion system PorP/SprF family membrane protein
MRIPRDFDRWMFDYKEGNLSQSEVDYFEHHIIENPQYQDDVEAWDNSYVKNQNMAYPQMDTLLKEKSYGKWLGWVAAIIILFVSVSTLFIFSGNQLAKYSLRTNAQKNALNEFSFSDVNTNKITNTLQLNGNQVKDDNYDEETLDQQNIQSQSFQQQLNQTQEVYLTRQLPNQLLSDNIGVEDNNVNYSSNNKTLNKNNKLLSLELNKISNSQSNHYQGTYKSNPKYTSNKSQSKKSKSKHKLMAYKLKKLYRKIDRMTGYPIGLVNLHDPEILTPNSNLLSSNFGFTGSFGANRFEVKQRMQWLGQQNTLEQSYINFDTYNKALKSGVGIMFNRNSFNLGQYEDYNINFLYSPKFQIGRKLFFEPAVKLTMGVLRMNAKKVNYNSTYEIDRGRIIFTGTPDGTKYTANNLWYKDFGVGFVLNTDKLYVGVNADNLSHHNEFIYGKNKQSPVKINAIIGSDYQSKNKKMILSPFITYTQVGKLKEVWGGVNTKLYWLTVGGAYSSLGDYSASLGLKFRNFKLIYQYDKTTSFINNDRFASHNIGIRINTKQKLQR